MSDMSRLRLRHSADPPPPFTGVPTAALRTRARALLATEIALLLAVMSVVVFEFRDIWAVGWRYANDLLNFAFAVGFMVPPTGDGEPPLAQHRIASGVAWGGILVMLGLLACAVGAWRRLAVRALRARGEGSLRWDGEAR